MLNGIDLSHFQTTTPNLTNEDFVFVKTTDGLNKDPMYDMHVSNVLKAEKVLGDYAFGYDLSPTFSAEQQAAAFLLFRTTELLALDLENSKIPMTNAQGAAFIAYVHSKGHKIGLYHSDSGFPNLGQDWNWVANWSTPPIHPWTFWQSKGGPLDQDVFNGDMTALLALAGKDDMAGLVWTTETEEHGTLEINGPGVAALRLRDGVTVNMLEGSKNTYYATIKLAVPYPGTPADSSRQLGYLIGIDACCLLRVNAKNVVPTIVSPPVDTATLQKTAFNNAISYAVTAVQGLTKP
jgi:Glycosyl hydrolases family 25